MSLSVVILTRNEAIHLARALKSISSFATDIVIVDSFSTDSTREIAAASGARFFQREFRYHADQFSWALENIYIESDWIFRLDADEVIHEDLALRIKEFLANPPADVTGVSFQRRHVWMGRWVRFGGRYPVNMLRMWRRGYGRVEDRWMDEHIVVSKGLTVTLKGGFSDWNLNDLSFFTDKHNRYATREAIDILAARYRLFEANGSASLNGTNFQARFKRYLKIYVYNTLPFWISAPLYFLWRYFIQFGFLDGKTGLIYHVLQGFWYRFLVGAKVLEFDLHLKALATREARISKLQELSGHRLQEP